MKFYVLTLFPDMINQVCRSSILGRACEQGLIQVKAVDIREFSTNKHRRVDDYPYGGGAGMVMQAEPIYLAYQSTLREIAGKRNGLSPEMNTKMVYLSPQGKLFHQDMAMDYAKYEDVILLCGHYEGVDERVLDIMDTERVSIGNYVLTGGELPALVMIDAIARWVPGVLSNEASAEFETFQDNLLEYPQYTRPETFMDKGVPEVLLSGHHANIEKWRREQSLYRTYQYRPDLLKEARLTKEEQDMVNQWKIQEGILDS